MKIGLEDKLKKRKKEILTPGSIISCSDVKIYPKTERFWRSTISVLESLGDFDSAKKSKK